MDEREFSYSDDVLAAVDSGRQIEAIKILREQTGLGLKDAKHAIDALARERRGNPAIAPNMAEEGGAGGVLKLVFAIIVVLGAFWYLFGT